MRRTTSVSGRCCSVTVSQRTSFVLPSGRCFTQHAPRYNYRCHLAMTSSTRVMRMPTAGKGCTGIFTGGSTYWGRVYCRYSENLGKRLRYSCFNATEALQLTHWELASGLANVVSSTLVLLPGTVCLLIYTTLQTEIHSRSGLKLFCLIVHTDLFLVVRRSWTVRIAALYKSRVVLYCIVTEPPCVEIADLGFCLQ